MSAVVKDADRIRAVLSASGQPLTSAQIAEKIDELDAQAVSSHLYSMHKAGGVIRVTDEATGRYAYLINPKYSKGKPARSKGTKPARGARAAKKAPAAAPRRGSPPKAVAKAKPPVTTYRLYDHISAALQDLDELVGDAINHDAPKDALKEVWAAQGALRRAQAACITARG
ncbi:MAG: hypothetical protein LW860_16380 [Xanthomonadaceae bacterium]|nr:hypothetical protein [Xanthomonadaceae bacterium]